MMMLPSSFGRPEMLAVTMMIYAAIFVDSCENKMNGGRSDTSTSTTASEKSSESRGSAGKMPGRRTGLTYPTSQQGSSSRRTKDGGSRQAETEGIADALSKARASLGKSTEKLKGLVSEKPEHYAKQETLESLKEAQEADSSRIAAARSLLDRQRSRGSPGLGQRIYGQDAQVMTHNTTIAQHTLDELLAKTRLQGQQRSRSTRSFIA